MWIPESWDQVNIPLLGTDRNEEINDPKILLAFRQGSVIRNEGGKGLRPNWKVWKRIGMLFIRILAMRTR